MIRNPKYNEFGSIDLEVKIGDEWVPFTASPNDTEKTGQDFYAEALEMGPEEYVAPPTPPEPTPEEILAQERAAMVCTRRQGKLALGPTVWASTLDLLNNPDPSWSPTTLWALQVAIEDTVEWRRTDPDMQILIWAMNLTDEQADNLFRLAMTL